MSVFGIDYAWGRPGAAAIVHAGAHFVCRYLSHDTSGKNLTSAEAKSLSAAGLWIVVVWESTANRALSGHAAGVADAKTAAEQAKVCGMPGDRPIYFAVDFDATQAQQAAINAYLDGAASELGHGRVGIYGGYWPVKRALDGGHAKWAWQTYAWSGGQWDARAQIQQYSNNHTINGVGVDYDRAVHTDYGQWKVGVSPAEEDDDMPLNDADKKWIKDAVKDVVYTDDVLPAPGSNPADGFDPAGNPGFDPKANPTWAGQSFLKQMVQGLIVVNGKVDRLAATGGGAVDLDALADKVVDKLAQRLES